jgi:ribosome-binding factor A
MSRRIAKVNELIKREVSEILEREIAENPGIFSTVSKVDTSNDLRYARIFLSIFPEEKAPSGLAYVKKNLKNIERHLFKRLSMKIIPKLILILDTTEEQADEIEHLLRTIAQEHSYDSNPDENPSSERKTPLS